MFKKLHLFFLTLALLLSTMPINAMAAENTTDTVYISNCRPGKTYSFSKTITVTDMKLLARINSFETYELTKNDLYPGEQYVELSTNTDTNITITDINFNCPGLYGYYIIPCADKLLVKDKYDFYIPTGDLQTDIQAVTVDMPQEVTINGKITIPNNISTNVEINDILKINLSAWEEPAYTLIGDESDYIFSSIGEFDIDRDPELIAQIEPDEYGQIFVPEPPNGLYRYYEGQWYWQENCKYDELRYAVSNPIDFSHPVDIRDYYLYVNPPENLMNYDTFNQNIIYDYVDGELCEFGGRQNRPGARALIKGKHSKSLDEIVYTCDYYGKGEIPVNATINEDYINKDYEELTYIDGYLFDTNSNIVFDPNNMDMGKSPNMLGFGYAAIPNGTKFSYTAPKWTSSEIDIPINISFADGTNPPTDDEDVPVYAAQNLVVKQKFTVNKSDFCDGSIKSFRYSSKGLASASIKNGIITFTALKPGDVTVTALDKNKNKLGNITLHITKPVMTKIKSVKRDEVITPDMYISEPNAVTKYVSSKPTIASVDEKTGEVTIHKAGTANITAYYGEGKNAAKYKTTVTVKLPVISPKSVTLKEGKTKILKIQKSTLTPTWSSEDTSIASVDSYGTVTAIHAGTTNIIATIDGVDYKCPITVTPTTYNVTVTSLDEKITANQLISEPTIVTKWSSGDKKIATVDDNGNVTALKNGKVTITATVGTGKKAKKYNAKVNIKLQ